MISNKSARIILAFLYMQTLTSHAAPLLTVQYKSPNNVMETCEVAGRMGDAKYKEKDLEEALKLCSYDLYANPTQSLSIEYSKKGEQKVLSLDSKSMGHCPKVNSSNPGTLFMEIPESLSLDAFNNTCYDRLKKLEEGATENDYNSKDVKAKFKSSISCSYAPAALAAYHLSRFFNGAGRVPVAVYRTYDKDEHFKTIENAQAIMKKLGVSKQLIGTTWSNFKSTHANPKKFTPIFTNDGQVYGALNDNPKNEEKFSEVSNFKTYDTRYSDFQKGFPFKLVSSEKAIIDVLGNLKTISVPSLKKYEVKEIGFNQSTVQAVLLMKDVSDMILMDHILAQEDRIGNIHYKMAWYYKKSEVVDGTEVTKVSRDGVDYKKGQINPEQLAKMQALGAFQVKEMLLKDNDCAVAKVKTNDNYVQKPRVGGMRYPEVILAKVRHMSLDTYKRLMDLSQYLKTDEAKQFFKQELKFIDEDFSHVASLVEDAKSILVKNCESGLLKLDANIEDFMNGYNPSTYTCK